jgi:hypothetical protein
MVHMRRIPALAAALTAIILALALSGQALAHEEVTVGKYKIEVGWVVEPPVVGEANGIYLSVINTETNEPPEHVDETLRVFVMAGGQTGEVHLQPLGGSEHTEEGEHAAEGEAAHGAFSGPLIPTARGVITVKLEGKIEEQDVNVSVDIEEVEAATALEFPISLASVPAMNQQLSDLRSTNQSLQDSVARYQLVAAGGVILGLAGLAVGLVGMRRK